MFGSKGICEHILCLSKNTIWVRCGWQLRGTDNFARWEQFLKLEKWSAWKMHSFQRNIYSTQMLQTRVFIFPQHQSNSRTVFQSVMSQMAVEWGREDLSLWWREWQRQEKWDGETGEIKSAEADSERGGFLVSKQQQAREREGTIDVMANHFPSDRVRSSSLMQRHQGNGWCGADMLLCLAMLV